MRQMARVCPGGAGGRRRVLALTGTMLVGACGGAQNPHSRADQTAATRPSILLVTLDTTRADTIGPEARGVDTPFFNALAARGRRFRQAYATAPETLPSHASMMTGLYPAGHTIRENARYLPAGAPGPGRAAPPDGVSHGRLRIELRAVATLRTGPRVRRLRRRAAGRARRADGPRDDGSGRRVASTATRDSLSFSGSTTSTRTPRTPLPSRFAAATPRRRTSARSRRWTSSWGASCWSSSGRRRVPSPSWSSATTARASATTASRSTATSSTRPRCTFPCWSWDRVSHRA